MRLRGVSEDGEDVLEYLPKLEESFKNIGIQIRKDENTFKSTYEIMSDLASVWGELTDVQRAHMSELVAGKRQGNIVMAMMSNYKDMQDSLTTALNSTNSALIENEKYMESIEAKSAQFKNTAIGKWQEALDSNLIKNFVVAMTTLVEVLGNLNIVLAISTTAFLLWKGEAILGSISALASFITTESMATVSTTALTGAVGILTKSFNALKLAVSTNPLGALAVVITTVVVGLKAYTNHVEKAREETEKLIQTIQSDVQNLKSQKEGLQELSSEYETLKNKEKNLTATTEEKKRLLDIQKELVDNYGVSATGINLEGEAYADSIEAIKLRTLALEEEIAKEKEKLELNVLSADALNTKDIRKNVEEIDKLQKKLEIARKALPYLEENDPYAAKLKKEQIAQMEKDIEESNSIIQKASKERKKYLEYEAQETIKTLESNGKEMSDSAKLIVSEFAKSLALQPEDIETQQQSLNEFIDKINNSELDALIEKYNKFISDINSGDDSKKNRDGLSKTSKEITNLINTLTKSNPDLKEFAINFASLYPSTIDVKNAINTLEQHERAVSTLATTYKESSASIKNLNNILSELDKGKGLSTDSITKILESYPELIDYLDDEVKLREKITDKVDDYQDAIYDAFVATKQNSNEFYNSVKNENVDLFNNLAKAYNSDIDNWSNLAQAKQEINAKLISQLGADWVKYFEAFNAGNTLTNPSGIGDWRRLESGDALAIDSTTAKQFELLNALNEATRKQAEKFKNLNVSSSLGSSSSSFSSSKYISDQYALSISALNTAISQLEGAMSKLNPTSDEYRQKLEQINSLTKQKQILTEQEAIRLRALRSQVAQDTREYDDYTKSIESLSSAWWDFENSISDNNFKIINSQLSAFDETIDDLNNQLFRSKTLQSALIEETEDYNNESFKQVDITNQLANSLKQKEQYIQKELASGKLTIAQNKELTTTLKQVKEAQEDLYISYLSDLKAYANEVVNIYKDMYKRQKDAEIESLNKQMKIEDERHKNVLKNLDEELDHFNKIINDKIKALDDEAKEEDYLLSLQKLQRERQDIADLISVVKLDKSAEGRKKVDELTAQLAKKESEIEEKQRNHTLELRKQNLQDMLDNYKEDVEEKKESEDEKYGAEKNRIDKIIRDTERMYDELTNDEEKFSRLREQILSGNLTNMQSAFKTFETFVRNNMSTIGRNISTGLINKLRNASSEIQNLIEDMNDLGVSTDIGTSPDTNTNSHSQYFPYKTAINEIVYAKGLYEGGKEGKIVKIATEEEKSLALSKAEQYYSQIPSDIASKLKGMKYTDAWKWYKEEVYHEGGIVGSNKSRPPKLVELLNKIANARPNETYVKSLYNELQIPPQNIANNFIPNMQKLVGMNNSQKLNVIQISELLHIDNFQNNTSSSIDEIINRVTDKFVEGMRIKGHLLNTI